MIFDNLKNSSNYFGMHENFKKAFEFLKKATDENLPIGKYELDGENLFASVQEYKTKLPDESKFEGHEKYIDIQYIISGAELIEVVDIGKAVSEVSYDSDKDVEFYKDCEKAGKGIIEAGEYGIFMPYDIHKPGMCINKNPEAVKKVVVKVKVK